MVVKNKLTYIYLLISILGCAVLFYKIAQSDYNHLFIVISVILIGIYFFIKFNTRSRYLNPDHPIKNKRD